MESIKHIMDEAGATDDDTALWLILLSMRNDINHLIEKVHGLEERYANYKSTSNSYESYSENG